MAIRNTYFDVRESDLVSANDGDYTGKTRVIESVPDATVSNSYLERLGRDNQFGGHNLYSRFQQQTFQGLVSEAINIQGITVKYLIRTAGPVDELWNEDPDASWGSAFEIDMYVESYDAPGGAGQVLSQYGIEFNDQVTLSVSQDTWAELSPQGHPRPDGGDLIVVPFGISASNRDQYLPKVFQIADVSTFRGEAPFYQLGDNFVYRITANLFTQSGETIDFDTDSDSYTQNIIDSTNTDGISPLFLDSDSESLTDYDEFADNRIIEIIANPTNAESDGIVVQDFVGGNRWGGDGVITISDSDLDGLGGDDDW